MTPLNVTVMWSQYGGHSNQKDFIIKTERSDMKFMQEKEYIIGERGR